MTDTYETDTDTKPITKPVYDPAAKTRIIVGGILIGLAWLVSAACTLVLVVAWPTGQTSDNATSTVLFGVAVAIVSTFYLAYRFIK